jgi:hypothetical protein
LGRFFGSFEAEAVEGSSLLLTDEEEMIDVSGVVRRQEKKVRKKRQETLCVDSLELIVLDALSRPEVRGKDPEMFRPSEWGCEKSE